MGLKHLNFNNNNYKAVLKILILKSGKAGNVENMDVV